MKLLSSLLLILILGCSAQKPFTQPLKINAISCPKNGNCTIEIIPNKTITFQKDEFGKTYHTITEGDKTLIIYEYTRIQEIKRPDGHYSEKIIAEIDASHLNQKLENEALQQVKLYYGRFCYCKDAAGYFPVTNGLFHLQQKGKDSLRLHIKYNLKKVPQITSEINEIISLK